MFQRKKIYLAGPIAGLSYDDARNGWRVQFTDMLRNMGLDHIECFSPMRGKDFLKGVKQIGTGAYDNGRGMNAIGSQSGVICRDYNDVQTCDLMIAFLMGAQRVSIGTMCEYGFAHANRKPIITIMENPTQRVVETKEVTETFNSYVTRASIEQQLQEKYGAAEIIGHHIEHHNMGDQVFKLRVPGKVETVANVHEHLFVRGLSGYCVDNLEDAAFIAGTVLTPGA